MAIAKNETDIRIQFKHFDESVLIGIEEVRQLVGANTTGAVYAAVYRGDLPAPMVQRNRQLRWSVGQIRHHLNQVEDDFRKRQIDAAAGQGQGQSTEGKKRFGRPRKEIRPFSVFEKV